MATASPEAVQPATTCPFCRAEQRSPRATCWLCGGALPPAVASVGTRLAAAGAAPPRPDGPSPYSFSLSSLLLITTLVALCCGLIASYPGLGILASIVLVPVLVRTAMVVRRREAAGGTVAVGEKIALGATSFAVTLVIALVVGFSAFCCFCATCATLFGMGSGAPELLGLAVGAAVLGALGILISARLIKASRRRFERDAQGPPPDLSAPPPADPLGL